MAKNEKYGIPQGQFKAGNHWCQRFMKRNGLSLRQKTTLAQRLPDDYEEKIVRFHRYIIDLRKEHNYPLHVIANMDETPLTFDMPPNRTINNSGEKTIKIRTTGNEKNRITVVLTCAGDGSKLIESSFLKCGITNSLDGSEDDLVYEANDDCNNELDDSFARELFQSDSESESFR